jgi:hypothetical protein
LFMFDEVWKDSVAENTLENLTIQRFGDRTKL